MAKVKSPLMSAEARGKLADSVVHFPWKGINAVREYVIPANPRTAAQTTQRDRLTAAVAEWHAALYTAADVIAWNRYAGIIKGAMTGFNAMVKTHILEAIKTNTWERIRDVRVDPILTTTFRVLIEKTSAGNAPTLYYGKSKTFMPNSLTFSDLTDDLWEAAPDGLTKDTLYYFYIDVGTSGTDYGRTGIYSVRTAAA